MPRQYLELQCCGGEELRRTEYLREEEGHRFW